LMQIDTHAGECLKSTFWDAAFDDACAQQKKKRLRMDETQAVKVLIRICTAVVQAWLD